MKCLVTGGAGFIGSHLVEALLAEGHRVRILDDFSTGNMKVAEDLVAKGAMLQIDSITDYEAVLTALHDVEIVFHLAALPRVVRSVEDPIGTHNVNVTGFLNIMQGCREVGINKIVYASSSSVYGDQTDFVMEENMKPNPISPYAMHKLMNEQYAKMFNRLFKINSIGLRFFNVYGPRQSVEGAYALVVGKFLRMKRDGEKLTIFGDGKQTRDYTHVSDVVRAIILAGNKLYSGEECKCIFNVGTGVETDINQIAELVLNDTDSNQIEHIIPNPRGDFEELRKCANVRKIHHGLGWEAEVSIQEGIERLLQDEEVQSA